MLYSAQSIFLDSSVKHWDLVDNVHTAATRMTPCACWL
ncbi:hypothetical protein WANA31_1171 [Wolbachia endosymbiont of Drosophila ananassae]|nr:hypothetical protein WANA31_1171 [Wolbachia endosymbiont of Drosophila ananassae]RLT61049.1 hypothetical protein WANA34_1217 [Wolbachia endosymbiont of Drosophila ananassae]RLT62828.1 hypothetical protein WANA13_0848 [Wolbachia endosymbiont of Drosophila ananassae]